MGIRTNLFLNCLYTKPSFTSDAYRTFKNMYAFDYIGLSMTFNGFRCSDYSFNYPCSTFSYCLLTHPKLTDITAKFTT